MKAFCIYILIGITLFLYQCSFPVNDYTDDLGNGYLFVSESNANQFIYNTNDTSAEYAIPCTVEAFAFDDFYIIAKQKNNPDCSSIDISNLDVNYWIINKSSKMIFGPLDSLSFIHKRAELSVSSSLDLEN